MIASDAHQDSHGTAQAAHDRAPRILTIVSITTTLLGLGRFIAQGRADAWLLLLPAVALKALTGALPSSHVRSGASLAGSASFMMLYLR